MDVVWFMDETSVVVCYTEELIKFMMGGKTKYRNRMLPNKIRDHL